MDLTNNETGVPAWIKKACPLEEDLQSLKIFIGETSNRSRADAITDTYWQQLEQSLLASKVPIEKLESRYPEPPYGIYIARNNPEDIKLIDGNKKSAKEDILGIYEGKNIDIEVSELYKNDGQEIEIPLVNARLHALGRIAEVLNKCPGGKRLNHGFGRVSDVADLPSHLGGPNEGEDIIISYSDIKLRPICVFDGSSREFIDTETIMQSNAFVNPSRVRRNAQWDELSSEEGHRYCSSDSSLDSIEYSQEESLDIDNKADSKDYQHSDKSKGKSVDRSKLSKYCKDEMSYNRSFIESDQRLSSKVEYLADTKPDSRSEEKSDVKASNQYYKSYLDNKSSDFKSNSKLSEDYKDNVGFKNSSDIKPSSKSEAKSDTGVSSRSTACHTVKSQDDSVADKMIRLFTKKVKPRRAGTPIPTSRSIDKRKPWKPPGVAR